MCPLLFPSFLGMRDPPGNSSYCMSMNEDPFPEKAEPPDVIQFVGDVQEARTFSEKELSVDTEDIKAVFSDHIARFGRYVIGGGQEDTYNHAIGPQEQQDFSLAVSPSKKQKVDNMKPMDEDISL